MHAQIIPFTPNGEVGRVISDYLTHLRCRLNIGAIGEKTLTKNLHYLNTFARDYGQSPLAKCNKNTLEKWLFKHPEWKKASTLADAVGIVMACFRWAVDDDQIIKNPFRRPRDMPEPGPRTPIEPSEYRRMMREAKACDGNHRRKRPTSGPFRFALFFLWRTGSRPAEMRGALWDDLDWRSGAIELFEHKTGRKTGLSRIITLDRWVLWILARAYQRRPDSPNIFVNSRKRPWTKDFAKIFRKYATIAGVRAEISAYCLRHGVCVDLIEHGASDRQAADYLGHKSTKYISWYGRGTRRKLEHLRRIGDMRRKKLDAD